MAVSAADVLTYAGAGSSDLAVAESVLPVAVALVTTHLGAAEPPETVRDRAVLEVASELFHRRNAPQGISQFGAPDGSVVRVARDPMVAAYPLLAPWVVGLA
ncbi:hypothetical protein SAMN06309944_0163 [Micrococcales bacterium KH10]|nr:hypothetical protein SAMN06309944_0163 [Micrococcales bacterium KH10]